MPQESPRGPILRAPGALTPGQLKALYPYHFAGREIYLHFARGWMSVMEDMCREVNELMRGRAVQYVFRWVQFKEKFGIGRFYYHLRELKGAHEDPKETSELRNAPLDTKLRAEERTASLCEFCGQPGEMVAETAWRATLCLEHAAMHRRRKPLPCSLADDGSVLL